MRQATSLLVALAALLAGCGKERGSTYACKCTFLTDFDDASSREVIICSPSAERAPDFARGCAQSGAPAPVEACLCGPEARARACEVGLCLEGPRAD